MSILVIPEGKREPIKFRELKLGNAFSYDGHLLLKLSKFPGDQADACQLCDGTVYTIPPDELVMMKVALVSILGEKT